MTRVARLPVVRLIAVSTVAAACGSATVTPPAATEPSPPAATSLPSTSAPSRSPSPSDGRPAPSPGSASSAPSAATPGVSWPPAIGKPADSGARIVKVERVRGRMRDLTIETRTVGSVKVRLLLPGAWDDEPDRRWPMLYLLHGATGDHTNWSELTRADELTRDADVLVVMPDAGPLGWYSDWHNFGDGGPPMWETFHTVELVQLLERNWRAGDRRAVAGLSMGGMGAMAYAARHPGIFLAAASYSGVLMTAWFGSPSTRIWGELSEHPELWEQHDPHALAPRLGGVELYVSYGNGRTGPLIDKPFDELEENIAEQNEAFLRRLREEGIPVTVDAYGDGTHDWPYWDRALARSLPMLLDEVGGG